jgi:hypothetical protein
VLGIDLLVPVINLMVTVLVLACNLKV